MHSTETLSTATHDTIRRRLLDVVERFLASLRRGAEIAPDLQDLDLLESLPLAAEEYQTRFGPTRSASTEASWAPSAVCAAWSRPATDLSVSACRVVAIGIHDGPIAAVESAQSVEGWRPRLR